MVIRKKIPVNTQKIKSQLSNRTTTKKIVRSKRKRVKEEEGTQEPPNRKQLTKSRVVE